MAETTTKTPPVTGSKRYRKAAAQVDPQKLHTVEQAVNILKTLPAAKFDETVDLVVRLNIDLKKVEGGVRGTMSLPHGLGKAKTVIVFADGEAATAAKAAGALEAGGEELVARVMGGWTEFDVAVAHPSMMRHVGKLGRVLGPQGKMPSPKSGTVTDNVAQAVREFAAGKIEYRTDAAGNVHVPVGKRSFEPVKLVQNIQAVLDTLTATRPAAVKGTYFRVASISSTMSPGLRLSV